MNAHRWVTAVIAMNAITLLGCVIVPPMLVISALSIPMGLVIIGLLFVPRQHIIKKLCDAIGPAVANAGIGMILLVLLTAGLKLSRKLGRSGIPNVDLSTLQDTPSAAAVIGSIVAVFGGLALFVVLWRYIGIARVLAAGYLAPLSIITLVLTVGGVVNRTGNVSPSGLDVASKTEMSRDPGFKPWNERRPGPRLAPSQRGRMARQDATSERTSTNRQPAISIDRNLPADEANRARIESFRERHSPNDIVVMKIKRNDSSIKPVDVRKTLQNTLGLSRHFFSMSGDEGLLLFVHNGPVSDIVKKLEIGEVLNVDEESRTIEFQFDDVSP